MVPNYIAAYKKYRADRNALYEARWDQRTISGSEYSKRTSELHNEFRTAWAWLEQYMNGDELRADDLKKDLDRSAKAKYDDIIERTNDIVGEITDASGLSVGAKGELNGYITGTRGRAKVQTIGAGGYNIQCFHFRTLIHSI